MPNENEIRERVHLAQLGLLGLAEVVNTTHSNLLTRHFAQARTNLITLAYQTNKVAELIPDEPGD